MTRYVTRQSSRESIKQLQRSLAEHGFDTGRIDGVLGRRTKAAVEAFQKANGLPVDGVVGPQTLAKLSSDSAEGASRLPRARPDVEGGLLSKPDVGGGLLSAPQMSGGPLARSPMMGGRQSMMDIDSELKRAQIGEYVSGVMARDPAGGMKLLQELQASGQGDILGAGQQAMPQPPPQQMSGGGIGGDFRHPIDRSLGQDESDRLIEDYRETERGKAFTAMPARPQAPAYDPIAGHVGRGPYGQLSAAAGFGGHYPAEMPRQQISIDRVLQAISQAWGLPQ